jgi:hypothetical protein
MDARRLLTINTGSSSLKAALYRLREDTAETRELRAEASRSGVRAAACASLTTAARPSRSAGMICRITPPRWTRREHADGGTG